MHKGLWGAPGGPSPSPYSRAGTSLFQPFEKKSLNRFAVRKIPNHRVPPATCLCMTLRDSLSRISTFWSPGRLKIGLARQ